MNTIERIKALAKEKDVKLSQITRKMGVSNGYFQEALSKNRELSAERLEQIAEILDTTVEYLRGETEEKERPSAVGELTETQKEIIRLFESASDEDKLKIMEYADYLISKRKK